MVNPHLPPSPEKEEKGLASPTHLLGSVETGFVRTLLWAPKQPSYPVAKNTPWPAPALTPKVRSLCIERAEPGQE